MSIYILECRIFNYLHSKISLLLLFILLSFYGTRNSAWAAYKYQFDNEEGIEFAKQNRNKYLLIEYRSFCIQIQKKQNVDHFILRRLPNLDANPSRR